MPAVTVRLADLNDMPDLMRIEEDCFGAERFSAEVVRAFLERDDTLVLVAAREGESVGSAMVLISEAMGDGRIASIAVLTSHRRLGIGSELLSEVERVFQEHKLARYTLEVETTNEPAISLYKTKGYEIRGTVKDFYGLGRPAYFMEKRVEKGRRLTVRSA